MTAEVDIQVVASPWQRSAGCSRTAIASKTHPTFCFLSEATALLFSPTLFVFYVTINLKFFSYLVSCQGNPLWLTFTPLIYLAQIFSPRQQDCQCLRHKVLGSSYPSLVLLSPGLTETTAPQHTCIQFAAQLLTIFWTFLVGKLYIGRFNF